jgi:hypothetical protein
MRKIIMNIIRSAMAHMVIALIISVIYALWWFLSSIRLLPEPSPISNALVPIAIALFLGLSSVGVDRFNQKDWHGRFDGVTGVLTDIFGKYTNEFIDQDSKIEAYNEILEKYATSLYGAKDIRASFYELSPGEGGDSYTFEKVGYYIGEMQGHLAVQDTDTIIASDSECGDERDRAKDMHNRFKKGKRLVIPDITKKKYSTDGWTAVSKKEARKKSYRSFASCLVRRKSYESDQDNGKNAGGLIILDSPKVNFFQDADAHLIERCAKVLEVVYNSGRVYTSGIGSPRSQNDLPAAAFNSNY